jgi:hypothetical protein
MVEGVAVAMLWLYAISWLKGMAARSDPPHSSPQVFPLPEFVGRVAVLGGSGTEHSQLLVGLALRQVRNQGVVLCLDGRQQKQTEVQFRLLLRGMQSYIPVPASGEAPAEAERTALSLLSRGLSAYPPLLLLNGVPETLAWARTLAFLLKAGVVVVEILTAPSQLVFGRYDTVLLLRCEQDSAEAYSKAVGRRASAEAIRTLAAKEGLLLHLSQTYTVRLPSLQPE